MLIILTNNLIELPDESNQPSRVNPSCVFHILEPYPLIPDVPHIPAYLAPPANKHRESMTPRKSELQNLSVYSWIIFTASVSTEIWIQLQSQWMLLIFCVKTVNHEVTLEKKKCVCVCARMLYTRLKKAEVKDFSVYMLWQFCFLV